MLSPMNVTDEVVSIVQVLEEDEQLRNWFLWLRGVPDNLRCSEIGKLAVHAELEKADAGLIAAIRMLGSPEVFRAVCETLRERRGERMSPTEQIGS